MQACLDQVAFGLNSCNSDAVAQAASVYCGKTAELATTCNQCLDATSKAITQLSDACMQKAKQVETQRASMADEVATLKKSVAEWMHALLEEHSNVLADDSPKFKMGTVGIVEIATKLRSKLQQASSVADVEEVLLEFNQQLADASQAEADAAALEKKESETIRKEAAAVDNRVQALRAKAGSVHRNLLESGAAIARVAQQRLVANDGAQQKLAVAIEAAAACTEGPAEVPLHASTKSLRQLSRTLREVLLESIRDETVRLSSINTDVSVPLLACILY